MKKILAVLMSATVLFSLAACASQNKEAETAAADSEMYISGMANPWVDSDRAGVLEATGFDLAAPADAANIAYSYMPGTGMAQMNYTQNGSMWVIRVQPSDKLEDISGIYCEWNNIFETEVAGMEAIEYSYVSGTEDGFADSTDCTRVINWYDAQNSAVYSLSVTGTELNGLDTAVYAEMYFTADATETA